MNECMHELYVCRPKFDVCAQTYILYVNNTTHNNVQVYVFMSDYVHTFFMYVRSPTYVYHIRFKLWHLSSYINIIIHPCLCVLCLLHSCIEQLRVFL